MGITSGLHDAPAPEFARETGATPPSAPKAGGWFRWYHVPIALVALLLVALIVFVTVQPIQVLPRMTLAPGFSFIDETGARLTSEDLRGSITLYNFTYTGCSGDCPATGASMAALQQRLAAEDTLDIPVRLVTISFDPARDTPEVLAAWLAEHDSGALPWTAATGEPSQLKNAIGGGFGAYYAQDEGGAFTFDPMFVLVDGAGIIRTRYRTATPDPETVARDLGLITREVANSGGAQKLAYDAAHLFLCYPD